jgi:hypothetical protein
MFEQWWQEDGRFYDPGTEDVPWFDKRKQLAEAAYAAGKKVGSLEGGNYKADDFTYPTEINFANGRKVKLRVDDEGRHCLSVGRW